MKKITLTSILALCMACPAMANIDKDASTATCDNATIGTTTGPANLQADWTANTINLKWYDGNNEISIANGAAQKTCTYDGAITLPSTPTVPTGYTFGGWKVRAASNNNNNNNQTPITLSTLYSSETINTFSSKSLNPGVYCEGMDNGDWYGNDEEEDCTDNRFNGLNNGEWRVTMPNGNVVKGEARCSTVSGSRATAGTPTDDLDLTNLNNGARYCWCKATSADTGNGSYSPVASSSWVFDSDRGNAGDCANNCARFCADDVSGGGDFRRAVFGVTE